jgi:transposase
MVNLEQHQLCQLESYAMMQHNHEQDVQDYGVAPDYLLPDEMWTEIEPLLPQPKPKKKMGRPRMSDHQAMNAIYYLLRTSCQWNALPRSLGAYSTVHDRFQEWREAGVFEAMWREGLLQYNDLKGKGIEWEWQAMDGAMTKAPLGKKRWEQRGNRASNRSQPDGQRQEWHQEEPAY